MAPKHHPTPLSGGDRKALAKELGRACAMTTILTTLSVEARAKGEALIKQADRLLLCESRNERMWADGGQIDPSPTIGQAVKGLFARNANAGFFKGEIPCSGQRWDSPRKTCRPPLASCRRSPAAAEHRIREAARGLRFPSRQRHLHHPATTVRGDDKHSFIVAPRSDFLELPASSVLCRTTVN